MTFRDIIFNWTLYDRTAETSSYFECTHFSVLNQDQRRCFINEGVKPLNRVK